jgi:methylenetetrahydrofolate dehydrogenase (NADP+)/methenyltetrahydrofolate cyclohydrolase
MKVLNGSELAGFIKERQAHEVRGLRQSDHILPKLAIVVTVDNPVIDVYMRLKTRYGADILVEVEVHRIEQSAVPEVIAQLNQDVSVQGIIIQLPLADPLQTEELVNMVAPHKDVDALGALAIFDPATPTAILWLLAGYNVDLKGKDIVLVGHGKLVGAPLERMMLDSGLQVRIVNRATKDLKQELLPADIIISATGSPGIIHSDMVKRYAVVIDAGVASEGGKTVGDLASDIYERDDLNLTPIKGGVGPLTVCALFENVIRASRLVASNVATQEP